MWSLHTFSRIFLMALLFIGSATLCLAQNNTMGRIAVLPFTGGTADERDGIAELFSMERQMLQNFMVIPRTTITTAISKEQNFQYSGMTDSDTMARLGNQFGANYVMAGSITAIGSANLLIVSIVKIDVIQQVAGDFLIYNSLDDLNKDKTKIEQMVNNLVAMMKKDSSNLDKLAVLPVQFSNGVNEKEGDALAQLLSVYMIQNGKYAVYPRTKSLEQVQNEYKTQLSGVTRDSQAVSVGRGVNPPYVLSIASRKIGSGNRFNAMVISLEGGNLIDGKSEDYSSLTDGINAMDFLARELSGKPVTDQERKRRSTTVGNAVSSAEKTQAAEERAAARAEATDKFLENAGINIHGSLEIQMFGADKPSNDSYSPNKVGGGGEIELRINPYFGVSTGVQAVPREIYIRDIKQGATISTVMVPVLLRLSVQFLYSFSLYGGVGINVASLADELNVESFSPACMIFGVEGGFRGDAFGAFVGVQYNRDFSESVYSKGGTKFDPYVRDAFSITLGLSYLIKFRN